MNNRETHRSYSQKLQDKRWLEFCDEFKKCKRLLIYDPPVPSCEICCKTQSLQVHHLGYRPDAEPWEYTFDEVQLLCEECHKSIHAWADDLWNEILKCKTPDMAYLALKAAMDAKIRHELNDIRRTCPFCGKEQCNCV